MNEVEVPSYFLCPVSLQIMRDPVTLPTGITYERESIERWLSSSAGNHATCPMTKQPVQPESDLTPNHTLRRLIQAWCAANSDHGVERFPTPRAPLDRATVQAVLDDVVSDRRSTVRALRKLKELVTCNERDKRCVESAGAAQVLVDVVRKSVRALSTTSDEVGNVAVVYVLDDGDEEEESGILALQILHSLQMSDSRLRELTAANEDFVAVLTRVLERSDYQSRTHATYLLSAFSKALSPLQLTAVDDALFVEIVKVLSDGISHGVTKAAVRVLGELCPWGRNKAKAAEAGAVRILVELLLDQPKRRLCEMIMIVLDRLCGCLEARQELLRHGAGVAAVSKKILRVSHVVTDRGVRILYSIVRFSGTPALMKEMLAVGVAAKLCLVLHADCSKITKDKSREILRLNSAMWKDSPCIAQQFKCLYP